MRCPERPLDHRRLPSQALRRIWVPFVVYLFVLVAVPLLDGAPRGTLFWEHAATALILPVLMVLVLLAVARLFSSRTR